MANNPRKKNHSKNLTGYPPWLEMLFVRAIDLIFSKLPRRMPSSSRLENVKIISHRGHYDNQRVWENTIEAFRNVRERGVWGIEFDLRWTRDLVPIVIHDDGLNRLFGENGKVGEMKFAQLKRRFPLIPSLAQVVDTFGKKMHLMMEIKDEHYPSPDQQNRELEKIFHGLEPAGDYHVLSLSPRMFDIINFCQPEVFLPIATVNLASLGELSLQKGYAGVNGHYLFVTRSMIHRHHQHGQKVGTGFIESENCLRRELNRDVDWFFSNDALRLQAIAERMKLKLKLSD